MFKINKNAVKNDKSLTSTIFKVICFIILAAYAFSIIFTFGLAVLTSLLPYESFRLYFPILPLGEHFTAQNYIDVFSVFKVEITLADGNKGYANIIGMLINSIIFSCGSAFLGTAFCCLMAYAVSKFNNWVSKVIYTIVIVCMALPVVGSLPSELKMMYNLNLYDTKFGLLFLSSSFLGMHFLVFHASFSAIPKDFSEAAKIDGAGEWRIFLSIMIPLVKMTFFTIFLLKFMVLWNNYETPLIHTPNHPVLAYGVFCVLHNVVPDELEWDPRIPHHLAAGMLVLIPMLVIFLFSHKRLIGNVSMGGVKG